MKKQYLPAQVEIVVLEDVDVLKVSGDFDPNEGTSDGSGWT